MGLAWTRPKIVAPACSTGDVLALVEAGADELYAGVIAENMLDGVADVDLLTRRQGRPAHVNGLSELAAVVRVASQAGIPVALTLNARCSRGLVRIAIELARRWQQMGGRSVIAADLGVLLELRQRCPQLQVHLSMLAGTFNSSTAIFFAQQGVRRIILPRDLTIPEMAELINSGPTLEYEALVMNQRCPFVESFCGFQHAVRLPDDVPCLFAYHRAPTEAVPVAYSFDPDYEGHGCQLRWQSDTGAVRTVPSDHEAGPHCGACQMPALCAAGVGYLKIAGRGYSLQDLVRAVRFARRAMDLWHDSPGSAGVAIQELYRRTSGVSCGGARCYYAQ